MDNRSPREIVSDALRVLDYCRDPEGGAISSDIETYLYLSQAYQDDECENWGVLSIAKTVLLRVV